MELDSLLLEGLSLLSRADLSGKDMSENSIETSGVEVANYMIYVFLFS